ncbi:MAG: sigma-70 family RNA polymerase sigma factor [Myxococcales bacterium]|nr:sigma-70 family RNA polymerase sigma factor [Myxococcales bacterium]
MPARTADRPIALIEQVIRGDEAAWHTLVESYLGFLYALAWRYARDDEDVAEELVLSVLEGLRRPDAEGRSFYRLRRYLESLARIGARSRFVTWLALVAKNLFCDWFREQGGRKVLPKEIEMLDALDREIFRAVFWEGGTERDAWERLRARRPDLSPEEFERHLLHVYRHLSQRNFWCVYQDLLRRAPARVLGDGGPGEGRPLDVPGAERPDQVLERSEVEAAARRVAEVLERAIATLPPVTRQVVRFAWRQGLSGEAIARAMGFRNRQRVYDELARARRRIRAYLRRAGVDLDEARQVQADIADAWAKIPADDDLSDPFSASVPMPLKSREPQGGAR